MCTLAWCWSVLCMSAPPCLHIHAVTGGVSGEKKTIWYKVHWGKPLQVCYWKHCWNCWIYPEAWPCYCKNGNSTYLPTQPSHSVSLCEASCFLSLVIKCHRFSWKTISWHWQASRLTASKDSTQKLILCSHCIHKSKQELCSSYCCRTPPTANYLLKKQRGKVAPDTLCCSDR